MRFQLALEDISVDVDNLIEMLIILKYATITQIGQEPKNQPKPPVWKWARANFGHTSDVEILNTFQNRKRTAVQLWADVVELFIDLLSQGSYRGALGGGVWEIGACRLHLQRGNPFSMQQFASKTPLLRRRFTNVSFSSIRYCGIPCAAHWQACSGTVWSRRAWFGQEIGDVKRLWGLTLSQEYEP